MGAQFDVAESFGMARCHLLMPVVMAAMAVLDCRCRAPGIQGVEEGLYFWSISGASSLQSAGREQFKPELVEAFFPPIEGG